MEAEIAASKAQATQKRKAAQMNQGSPVAAPANALADNPAQLQAQIDQLHQARDQEMQKCAPIID